MYECAPLISASSLTSPLTARIPSSYTIQNALSSKYYLVYIPLTSHTKNPTTTPAPNAIPNEMKQALKNYPATSHLKGYGYRFQSNLWVALSLKARMIPQANEPSRP